MHRVYSPLLPESSRMGTLPKTTDPELRARAVRLVDDHLGEYPAAAIAASEQFGRVGASMDRGSRLSPENVPASHDPGV